MSCRGVQTESANDDGRFANIHATEFCVEVETKQPADLCQRAVSSLLRSIF